VTTEDREPTVGAAPLGTPPSYTSYCTGGGEYERFDLLLLAAFDDPARGRLILAQAMSDQPTPGREWTPMVQPTRLPDGRQVFERQCPYCDLPLRREVAQLTAMLLASRARYVEEDISDPTTGGQQG
jgi:hypothetical protein